MSATAIELGIAAWAARIKPKLARTVEAIVDVGLDLIDAKAALPHGDFGPLLDELGLSPRVARRFMHLARLERQTA